MMRISNVTAWDIPVGAPVSNPARWLAFVEARRIGDRRSNLSSIQRF